MVTYLNLAKACNLSPLVSLALFASTGDQNSSLFMKLCFQFPELFLRRLAELTIDSDARLVNRLHRCTKSQSEILRLVVVGTEYNHRTQLRRGERTWDDVIGLSPRLYASDRTIGTLSPLGAIDASSRILHFCFNAITRPLLLPHALLILPGRVYNCCNKVPGNRRAAAAASFSNRSCQSQMKLYARWR